MTAELIVMNKNGIALAADSAVTISVGGRTSKIYNSANKLFMLSKYHPVGIMIYGSAEIMGLPWEAVIKRYRDRLGPRSFATLEKYCDDFFRHLSIEAFGEDSYVSFVRERAIELLYVIAEDADKKAEQLLKTGGEIEETEIQRVHKECIEQAYSRVKAAQKQLGIKNADIKDSIKQHRPMVSETISGLLENRPIRGITKRKLVDACLLFALLIPENTQSGLVLAGYGNDQIFPSARAFDIDKILDGKVHFTKVFEEDITLDETSYVRAFAQSNEVQSFMDGVSARLGNYFATDVRDVLSKAFGRSVVDLLVRDGLVAEKDKEACRRRLEDAGKGAYAYIRQTMDDISRREFSSPVVRAVSFFSPAEMATMAETLVSLESFRQQVTLSHETVGGPIDVSVITRGDGFVWMKRKHYFDPKLNHQFFFNYNRDRSGDDDDQNDR